MTKEIEATINRNKLGQFVDSQSNPHAITTQTAKIMQRKSVEARKRNSTLAARSAILEELRSTLPNVETWEDAWGRLTANVTVGLLDEDNLHYKVQAYKAIGQATDAFEEKSRAAPGSVNVVAIGDEMASQVLGMLASDKSNYQKHNNSQAVDVEYTESEDK